MANLTVKEMEKRLKLYNLLRKAAKKKNEEGKNKKLFLIIK